MTAKISLIIAADQLAALRAVAEARHLSLSDIVREAIRRMLEGQP
jgi:hypothetical protein